MSRMSSVPSVTIRVPSGSICSILADVLLSGPTIAPNARQSIVRRSSIDMRRMTYATVGSVNDDPSQPERRPPPETLGRGSVAKDQARDRRVPVGAFELLGGELPRRLADRHGA